jgi:hypothetical protein
MLLVTIWGSSISDNVPWQAETCGMANVVFSGMDTLNCSWTTVAYSHIVLATDWSKVYKAKIPNHIRRARKLSRCNDHESTLSRPYAELLHPTAS